MLGSWKIYDQSTLDYAELGHSMRSCPEIESIVKDVAIGAVVALGVDFGAVNMDVLVLRTIGFMWSISEPEWW